jgi:hypothetical protein
MTVTIKCYQWMILVAAWAGAAAAQQTGPTSGAATRSSNEAQAEAGEPRANAMPAAQPAEAAASHTPAKPAAAPVAAARTGGPAAKSTAVDRIELGTATVTGDREQPKVMYIVPWKKSDIGDLSGKPINSLLDEALAPVDRDEFKREVVYYQAMKADAPQNGAPRSPAKQGEK